MDRQVIVAVLLAGAVVAAHAQQTPTADAVEVTASVLAVEKASK